MAKKCTHIVHSSNNEHFIHYNDSVDRYSHNKNKKVSKNKK